MIITSIAGGSDRNRNSWAKSFDITHRVVADEDYKIFLSVEGGYDASTGYIYTPWTALITPGMVITEADYQISDKTVEKNLPE